ncbi:MAG: ABC transporter ATP-binding protein, partial [Oligoflexales bacterium]|nr:ABC transporter ATP-binding protein [Oligoflexales bacterium]
MLDDVGFFVENHTIAGILGPSGSGKTTILRMIMGFEAPDSGELKYGGQCLSKGGKILVPPEKRNFSIVFQEFILFPHLNVFQNIAIGLSKKSRKERESIVDELCEVLKISGLKKERISSLSGGEQQRVALARSLALRPKVLM